MAAPVSSTGQAMEDVLDLYAESYDPDQPVVCFDETSTQLLVDTRPPIPGQPGQPLRQDYEYRRAGTRNIFLTCEPLAGWRHVVITQRRTMQDFPCQMQWLVDVAYPDATVVRVVLDAGRGTGVVAAAYCPGKFTGIGRVAGCRSPTAGTNVSAR